MYAPLLVSKPESIISANKRFGAAVGSGAHKGCFCLSACDSRRRTRGFYLEILVFLHPGSAFVSAQVPNRESVCLCGLSRSVEFCFYGTPFSGNGGKPCGSGQLCGGKSDVSGDSPGSVCDTVGAAVLEKKYVYSLSAKRFIRLTFPTYRTAKAQPAR